MSNNIPLVIYHNNCQDGIAAAWVAWKWLRGACELFAANYGEEPPYDLLTDRQVIIVDFSYKKPQMEKIINLASDISVYDHHKTAQEELKEWAQYEYGIELENGKYVHIVFDMNESGCSLAWKHLIQGPLPKTLDYIKQGDIFKFTDPKEDVHRIKSFIESYPRTIEGFSQAFNCVQNAINNDLMESIWMQASAIQRFADRRVEDILKTQFRIKIDEFDVPACFCPKWFATPVAGALAGRMDWNEETKENRTTKIPFGVAIVNLGEKFEISLRSSDQQEDVSEIAKRFGGGGHRNAAGFGISVDDFTWHWKVYNRISSDEAPFKKYS